VWHSIIIMEGLQEELKACKARFGQELELSKAEKGAAGFPFPVAVTRYTPQPESAMAWDIDELPVRLVFRSADVAASPVSVEVADYLGPGELIEKIEKAVDAQWKKLLKKKEGGTWKLELMFDWIEEQFGDLLRLCPQFVDSYVGCDFAGASMKRYVLVEPKGEEDAAEEEPEEDEEELERAHEAWLEAERARIEAEFQDKSELGLERRRQAEQGLLENGEKAKQLSKAEKAELNKSRKEKSGHRWRKTGAKSNKPVVDEDAKAKGKKK